MNSKTVAVPVLAYFTLRIGTISSLIPLLLFQTFFIPSLLLFYFSFFKTFLIPLRAAILFSCF